MPGNSAAVARRIVLACAALLFGWSAAPAATLLPETAPTEAAPATVAEPEIEARQEAGSDEAVSERISAIFSEIPGLANVRARVDEGVVTLTGTVADPENRARAEAIASRVSGVVTVESQIERDVSIGGQLDVLGTLSTQLATFVAALPLIGVALIVALLIAGAGYGIASLTFWRRFARNVFLAELIASAIRFAFVIGGILVALNILGAGTLVGAVLGGAGVIGIALGFSLRDIVENYIASLMLSLRQPFRANELVRIEDYEGRIIRLTSRATILMTLDGNHVRIPNSTVFKAVIVNYTRNPQRNFSFDIGIDANADARAAGSTGVEALRGLDFVLADPAPASFVQEVAPSSITVRFVGWVDQNETNWFKARSRAIIAVKDAIEAAGIAIPEPIYRLRFDPGSPLPIEQEGAETHERPTAPASRPQTQVQESESVVPENEIARMVDAERASPLSGDDLLDSRRPVE